MRISKLLMPLLLSTQFAFSRAPAANYQDQSVSELEKLENAKFESQLAEIEKRENAKFESRKDLVLSKAKTCIEKNYGYRVSIDSIALLEFYYDDTKPDWKNNINEYSYEVWLQAEKSYVAKYIAFTKGDSVTKCAMDIKSDKKKDIKLALMEKRLEAFKKEHAIEIAKSDSIKSAMRDNEVRVFLNNKKSIEKKSLIYLKEAYGVTSIDSLALIDFAYNDSLPNYWNKITLREYDAWAIKSKSFALKIRLHTENNKIIKSEMVGYDDGSDIKLTEMQAELNAMAIIRESRKFKANKQSAIGLAERCLKEYANDPSSVKISKIYFHDATAMGEVTYNVIYRAKNKFGALVLGASAVSINGGKCIDISEIENDQ